MDRKRKAKKIARQASLDFPTWGGARPGAGRKRSSSRESVAHRARPPLAERHPVHVTLRLVPGLPSLRRRSNYRVVRESIAEACSRFSARIIQYSVMTNHVHLICEARSESALSRAIKGLNVRLARRLNAEWRRSGRVIADRYHARALKTPREVRNALVYLLHNARHHGIHFVGPDPCSSGAWFDGWDRDLTVRRERLGNFLPRPRTWLLGVGWKRNGPIPLDPPRRSS